MKGVIYFILLVFLIGGIAADCSGNQVDINIASEAELDEITYVGPVTAQSIVAKRPFEEVDDLIHVNGIGEVKLAAIKEQGLACVSKEPPEDEKPIKEEEITRLEDQEEDLSRLNKYRNINEFIENTSSGNLLETEEIQDNSLIQLTPQTIKSDENSESDIKGRYAIYGLIAFCVLLAALFAVKKKYGRRNEFD